jgi:hypothetical protein
MRITFSTSAPTVCLLRVIFDRATRLPCFGAGDRVFGLFDIIGIVGAVPYIRNFPDMRLMRENLSAAAQSENFHRYQSMSVSRETLAPFDERVNDRGYQPYGLLTQDEKKNPAVEYDAVGQRSSGLASSRLSRPDLRRRLALFEPAGIKPPIKGAIALPNA